MQEFFENLKCYILFPYPLFARFLVTRFRSCSFLPSSSSFATSSRSLSMPPNAWSTAAYIPIATFGYPFSSDHKVARLIPARSATSSVARFLLNLAVLIWSPILSNILCVSGKITTVFLLMLSPLMFNILNETPDFVNFIKHKISRSIFYQTNDLLEFPSFPTIMIDRQLFLSILYRERGT